MDGVDSLVPIEEHVDTRHMTKPKALRFCNSDNAFQVRTLDQNINTPREHRVRWVCRLDMDKNSESADHFIRDVRCSQGSSDFFKDPNEIEQAFLKHEIHSLPFGSHFFKELDETHAASMTFVAKRQPAMAAAQNNTRVPHPLPNSSIIFTNRSNRYAESWGPGEASGWY